MLETSSIPSPAADTALPPPAIGDSATAAFTPDQRIELTSACIPLVRTLRRRIAAYSGLWCSAGLAITLLALPAFVVGHAFLALTALIYGGSLVFFSLIRIRECRSIAALTDVGRSGLRRKVWLGFNAVVFLTALVIFIVQLVAPGAHALVALPASVFVMVVSISPAWEWCFVHRLIARNKNLIEDFCRTLGALYINPEESVLVPQMLDALYLLDRLQTAGNLRAETFTAVRAELIGLG